MKKLMLILGTLLLAGCLNAQTFQGFFRTSDVAVEQRMVTDKGGINSILSQPWMWRPAVFGTFTGIQFGGGAPEIRAFNTFGLGLSLANFSEKDGKAYCNYSLNITAITNVDDEFKIGGAVTVDVFDKRVGIGLGYIDNHPMLLTTFSYSF